MCQVYQTLGYGPEGVIPDRDQTSVGEYSNVGRSVLPGTGETVCLDVVYLSRVLSKSSIPVSTYMRTYRTQVVSERELTRSRVAQGAVLKTAPTTN